ncbi:putative flippase GtrA [Micromonospora luteifusca]|uniref:Flippase GtrA n=1 Tax=Micromonospora luteifusca TaxID=709860 RepID=A0ABS2LWB8_9ACTN|nr:GtrA family protein [Micromonospora luteifusca]MBM7492479.1 putative flippase GtrA [Micromonospora luteifusca]
MRLVRLLPERWQKFIHEALKFGIVGGINTVINYAVFNALALTVFVNGQLKASVIATIVATITSYLMNRHWTYRDRPKSALRREYLLFFLFNGAGLLIELGAVAVAKYGLDIHGLLALNVAKTAGVLLATLFRFWSYRTFVFQPVAKTKVEPEAKPTSTWHSIPRDEWDTMAEMDPVAELAESVSELEEEESADRADPPPGTPAQGRSKRLSVSPAADLDAELAAELHVSTRRAPRR